MQDFAAMVMYKLATHHTTGATAMYESHFTARAETYTDHDRRTADAHTAWLLTTLSAALRGITRRFWPRPAPSALSQHRPRLLSTGPSPSK